MQAPIGSNGLYPHFVAYPKREDFKPAYREPIQKFTHWAAGSAARPMT